MTEEEQKALLESQQAQSPSGSAFDAGMKDSLVEGLMTMLPSVIGYAAGGQGGAAIGSKVGLDINQDMAMRRANRLTAQQNEAMRLAKQDTEKKELGLKERQTIVAEKKAKSESEIERQKLAQNQKKLEMENAQALAKVAEKTEPKDTATRIAKLSSSDKARLDNSRMGLKAIGAMSEALSKGQNTVSLIGDNDFTMNRRMFEEAIGRMQSGGAINNDEADRFRELVPTWKDDSQTQRKKLALMEDEMRQRFQTLGFNPEEVIGIAAQPLPNKESGGSAIPYVGGVEAHASADQPEPDWASMSEADLKKFLGQ